MKHDFWQTCPFLRITLFFILGILLSDMTGNRMPFGYGAGAVMLLLAIYALLCSGGRRHPERARAKTLCLLLATTATGALDMGMQERPRRPLPDHYEAVLVSQPVVHGKVVMFDMKLTQAPFAGRRVHANLLRDTLDNRWRQLHVGDGIEACSSFESTRYHGDEAQTFIYTTNWVKRSISLTELSVLDRTQIAAMCLRSRLIDHIFPKLDQQSEAIVSAMVLGDKSYLDKSTKEAFAISGASHVLALSGLHLGIIYGVLTFVLGGGRRRRIYGVPALIQTLAVSGALWSFAFLVGGTPSVVRSATMITLYMIASLLGQRRMSLNTISFTAFVMLVIRPENLFDIGFQLSFAAVTSIVTIMQGDWSRRLPWPLSWIASCAAVSITAQLGTFPLVMYHFGRFSCYFILTNLIVIPCALAILVLAVALAATSFSTLLTTHIVHAMVAVAQGMNACINAVAQLPGASIEHAYINKLQVAALYVAIACAVWLVRKYVRWGKASRLV